MATAITTIQSMLVNFLSETTEVYLVITSNEPENPAWGAGTKHKSFPKSQSLVDILPDVENYLDWEYVCPTCKKSKTEVNPNFCSNTFHLHAGEELLKMFEDLEDLDNAE